MRDINDKRREELQKIINVISDMRDKLEELADTEEYCLHKLPDRMYGGERHNAMMYNAMCLYDAVDLLDDAIDVIETAKD